MESDREQWELSKENIQPLRQGRKIAHLQAALTSDAAQHTLIAEQKHKFESELRTYCGDDPLDVWYHYIHWVEQHYPKGGKDGNLVLLVQKCCSAFQCDERYTNDPRYLNVWLKLIDMINDPLEIYNFVFANNWCCDLAELYIRWAMELEKTGNYPRADAVFQHGLNRKARPLEDLQAHYRQFMARVVKIAPSDQGDGNSIENQRLALNALKTQGRTHRVPNNRVEAQVAGTPGVFQSTSRQPMAGQLQKTPAFSIFQEHATPTLLPCKANDATPLPLPHERVKENAQNPGKWSKAKLLQKHVPVVPISALENQTPKFVVHEDALQPPAVTPRRIPELCGPLSEKKLARAPALFIPCASESNPMMKAQYCKDKIYRGGEEYTFEEIRAARWLKKQNEKKKMEEAVAQQIKTTMEQWWQQKCGHVEQMLQQVAQAVPQSQNSSDATDSSKLTSVSLPPNLLGFLNSDFALETPKLQPTSRSEESLLAMNSSVGSCNHSETGRAPSPTLQTREAMKATMALFNQSLHLSDDFGENTRNGMEQVSSGRPPQLTCVPFAIFSDAGPQSAPAAAECSKKLEDGENKENMQPQTYTQHCSNRELAGILQPATNIPFVPLEEQHEMDADQDGLDDVVPLSNSKCDDFTFAAPRNSSAFAAMVKNVSTPLPPQVTAEVEQEDSRPEAQLPEQTFCEESARYPTTKDQDSWKANTCLSAIPEASDEVNGSSCSSTNAGLQSTTQHSQFQNAPRKNILQLFEKMNLSDLDPFSPTVREWAMENWVLKHSTAETISVKNVTFTNCNMPCIRSNALTTLGDKSRYSIFKKIGEGAYARIYRAVPDNIQGHERSSVNTDVVLKIEQPSCLWEFYISAALEERLQKHNTSLEAVGGVVQFNHAYIYNDGSILVTDLWKMGTLLDVVNACTKNNSTIPENIAMYFTIELLYILENLHRCNIIHCDFKPDNILLKELPSIKPTDRRIIDVFHEAASSLLLIDLGRSIDMDTFPPDTVFYRKIETQDFVCPEMMDSRPWTYQVDYFGLLATVHCMLFGTYMKVSKVNGIWKFKGAFKRYWQTDLWQAFFHELLNIPSCQQLPDLHSWRVKFQKAFIASEGYKTFLMKTFQLAQWCSFKG